MKKLLLAGVLFGTLVLSACGVNEDVTLETKKEKTVGDIIEKTEEAPKSDLGTRSNPIPFGETAVISTYIIDDESNEYATDISLSIKEVIRGTEAYNLIKGMNQFNEEAPAGYEWAMATVSVSVLESETADYPYYIDNIMYFKMVSMDSGDVYGGEITGTLEPSLSFEMYVGNTKEGYVADLVKVGEPIQIEFDDWLSGSVFFEIK